MKPVHPSKINIAKVLSIAGSDSGGGAGLQADIKVITSLGGYAMTVVTAVTAQNTLGVTRIQDIDVEVIEAQLDAVISDSGVDAVKIGMLASPAIVRTVAKTLKRHRIERIILDPVLRATSGASLGGDDTAQAILSELVPMASLVTPNLHEASILLKRSITHADELAQAANDLLQFGSQAVLIKGGHLFDSLPTSELHAKPREIVDYLIWRARKDDQPVILQQAFAHPRIDTLNTHGTGCSLASAIATYFADGHDMKHSVAKGIAYVTAGLEAGRDLNIGAGPGPLWHMHAFYPTHLLDESSTRDKT